MTGYTFCFPARINSFCDLMDVSPEKAIVCRDSQEKNPASVCDDGSGGATGNTLRQAASADSWTRRSLRPDVGFGFSLGGVSI